MASGSVGSTHRGNRVAREDRAGQEGLCQYILRNPFSFEKMADVAETDTVLYRSERTHGRDQRTFQVFGAEEFIGTITQPIPPKGYQMIRYFGRPGVPAFLAFLS